MPSLSSDILRSLLAETLKHSLFIGLNKDQNNLSKNGIANRAATW